MKCFLHIGTEKTGSTLIQDWLHINRNALLNNRIFLPTKMGGNNHYLLPAFFQSNSDNWNKNIIRAFARKNAVEELDDRLWKDKFITLASKEIELNQEYCDVAIITSEHFHRRIKSAFDINAVKYLLQNIFDEVYVVCYFREQFELALSLYSTALRGGSKATIQEFTRNVVPTNDYYNYFEIANNYATAFGKENCIFRIYDRENFIGNDIRKDFMKAINKTISFDEFEWSKSSSNESLFALQAVAFRVINEKLEFFNNDQTIKNEENIAARNQVLENDIFKQGKIGCGGSQSIRELFKDSNQKFFEEFFPNQAHFNVKETKRPELVLISSCENTVEKALELSEDLRSIKNFHAVGDGVDGLG